MALALTWTSEPGSALHHDCSGKIDTDGRRYWFEVVAFGDGVDVQLWSLPSRGQVRRSRDVKIQRVACKALRRAVVAAYRERIDARNSGKSFPTIGDARAPPP